MPVGTVPAFLKLFWNHLQGWQKLEVPWYVPGWAASPTFNIEPSLRLVPLPAPRYYSCTFIRSSHRSLLWIFNPTSLGRCLHFLPNLVLIPSLHCFRQPSSRYVPSPSISQVTAPLEYSLASSCLLPRCSPILPTLKFWPGH